MIGFWKPVNHFSLRFLVPSSQLIFVTQAYSEASVIVDLWLPGMRVSQKSFLSLAFQSITFFCVNLTYALGAETVSHEAILFDVIVVVAGQRLSFGMHVSEFY